MRELSLQLQLYEGYFVFWYQQVMYSFDQNGSTPSAYEAHSDGEVSTKLRFTV